MLRSLHMKLVMLMVLLILSLMTVVGAFLINSVVAFYIQDFYSQMSTVFGDQEIVSDLRTAADGETDGAGALKTVLNAYAGQLGVDTRNRNFYILDGEGTSVLASSNGESGASGLSYTGNLTRATRPPITWMWPSPSSGAAATISSISWTTRPPCPT